MDALLTIAKWLFIIVLAIGLVAAIGQGLALLDDLQVAFSGSVDAQGAGDSHDETTAGEFIAQVSDVLMVDGTLFDWLRGISAFVVLVSVLYTGYRWVQRIAS